MSVIDAYSLKADVQNWVTLTEVINTSERLNKIEFIYVSAFSRGWISINSKNLVPNLIQPLTTHTNKYTLKNAKIPVARNERFTLLSHNNNSFKNAYPWGPAAEEREPVLIVKYEIIWMIHISDTISVMIPKTSLIK